MDKAEYTKTDDILIINPNPIIHPKLIKNIQVFIVIFIMLNNFLYTIDLDYLDQSRTFRFLPLSIIIIRIAVVFLISVIFVYIISTLLLHSFSKSGQKTPYMILGHIELTTATLLIFCLLSGNTFEILGIREFFIGLLSHQNFMSYYEGFGTSVANTIFMVLLYGIFEAKGKGNNQISIKKTQIEIIQQSNYFFRKLKLDQIFHPSENERFQVVIKQDMMKWKFRTQYIFKSRYLTLEEVQNYHREPYQKSPNWAYYSVIIMYEKSDKDSMIPKYDKYGQPIFGSNLGLNLRKKEAIELLDLLQEFISIEIVQPLKHDITYKAPGVLKYFENENRI